MSAAHRARAAGWSDFMGAAAIVVVAFGFDGARTVWVVLFSLSTLVLAYLYFLSPNRRTDVVSEDLRRVEETPGKNVLREKFIRKATCVGSWEWDRVNGKMNWSDEALDILGLGREQITRDPQLPEKRIHPADLKLFHSLAFPGSSSRLKDLAQVEVRAILPSGETKYLRFIMSGEDEDSSGGGAAYGLVQDITEVKRKDMALRESEAHLKEIERIANLGSGSWQKGDERPVWSDEMNRIFGRDAGLPGPSYSERESMYTPESWSRYNAALKLAVEAGEPYELELKIVRPDKTTRDVRVRGGAEADDNGNFVRVVGTVQDITEWKKTEEIIRLHATALQSAANAIAITDSSGRITYVNAAFEKLTGYTQEEAGGQTLKMLNSGKQDSFFYRNLWDTINAGIVWRGHLVNRRKDGTLYDEEETITPVKSDGTSITHFIAIKKDITEQIRSEQTLRSSMSALRELSHRLEKVREEERKSISHEVHDELGQVLTAVKMNLVALRGCDGSAEDDFRRKADSTIGLIDDAMKTVRDISARLRPGVLDYLGLIPAIEWQVERFQKISEIKCRLSMPEREPELDEERSTVLFRILQEALTNVARHAKASSVDICLSEYDGEYLMSVIDDGIGITPEQVGSPRSFGLLGIRERLRPLGGRCVIQSRDGGGTAILVALPRTDVIGE